ncbi:GNAT family N-acetyltransferase [Terribacillus sp. DMT04]|uniref:GNAT family N-acetyltransferase n=1 Tax=Terribacillus sp. DMT04 TaxID=2850441 RepID=UPI001C2BB664|nr:GNAT family N-acetyltransferase [Terribacillus sp. DMT04]QXE03038.1 GNAT family N-acetyltransferase [Terribacillus sp. DMT04]
MQIVELTEIGGYEEELANLFEEIVAAGASMNYLYPMQHETALAYWQHVLSEHVRLFICLLDGKIAGTVQVQLSDKENGQHRAEIAKLMTHPDAQRKGIARKLLQHAEQAARQEGRTLLLLDTEKDGPANVLYQSEGYVLFGEVPAFAQDAFGKYKDGNFYYKKLI